MINAGLAGAPGDCQDSSVHVSLSTFAADKSPRSGALPTYRLLHCAGLLAIAMLAAALNCAAQTYVVTQHNDNTRSGLNANETVLNTTNVNVNTFGKLFTLLVDGQVYAEPLYVPNVTFPGNVMHNVLIVATENDSVYAFDADSNTGANANPLWHANLLDSAHGAGPSETPFASSNIPGCADITPQIGVSGTPVIDLTTSPPSIYLDAKSQNGTTFFHRLHALNITTGNEESQGPAVLSANVSGTGDGSANGILPFQPIYENQRNGLLLLNGVIYVSFGSHCDYQPYHGWLFAYNAQTFTQTSVFVSTPNAGGGGIWNAGIGLSADSNGYLYASTGNGNFDTNGPVTDYGDTLLKFYTVDSNNNNGILSMVDYFTPFDQASMFANNSDLSSGGILLLPDQSVGNYPHLLVTADKQGTIYLVNRDQFTSNPADPGQPDHYCTTCITADNQIVQESPTAYITNAVFGGPAYWNNTLYFWGTHGPLTSIPLSGGLLNLASPSVGAFTPPYPGGVPTISSNLTTSGTAIVWASTLSGIYAYNAQDLSEVLWASTDAPNGRDAAPTVKCATPTIVNGKVYVGASGEVVVYGLLPLVKPLTATLGPGQTQQFTTTVTNPAWSISPTNVGSISSSGLYSAPSTISSTQTVTITATGATGSSASATVELTSSLAGVASATFLDFDVTTQGNWIGTYGADGYAIAASAQNLPVYDPTFALLGAQTWTWAATTGDPRAPQTNSQGGRIASTWFSGSMTFNVNINEGQTHQVALYALDWDNQGRGELVQIADANSGRILDQELAYNLSQGTYLVWNISGNVTITVTSDAGPNAAISGVFFGGGGSNVVTAKASFTGADATTQGNWTASYGSQGYALANVSQSFQVPVTFAPEGEGAWTWAATTTDPRALLLPSGGGGRTAATWYGATFTFDLNLTDGQTHEIALYALDWDNVGRGETVEIVDAGTNTVLDTRTISGFSNGLYLIWNISGHVQIVVTATSGPNAVISGLFIGSAGSVSTPSLSITNTNTGSFTQGQQNATYTVTVSNATGAGPTSGTVMVTETVPSGLTLVSMAGNGWTCPANGNTCTETNPLSGGSSYSPITVTVDVMANASSPQVNEVSVSGGGSATANAPDSTTITTTGGGGVGDGNTASFQTKDTQSEGNWQSSYGGDGYAFAAGPQSLPSYATFAATNQPTWTWVATTTDPRALTLPGGTGGIAAAWYNTPLSFTLSVGSSSHEVSLYALDWDSQGRSEKVVVSDANTGAALDTETISSFVSGAYLVWNVTGNVTITVTNLSGPNAVISGVFFGGSTSSLPPPTPATAAFTGADTATQGNWVGVYGSNGYTIANAGQNFLIPVTTSVQLQPNWTWVPTTTDPRALHIPGGTEGIAATWYTTPTLSFDLNLTDGLQHQVALYVLDWDNKGRAETIQIVDTNSGKTLDTESIPGNSTTANNFVNGTYFKWKISGHVTINVTLTGGPNAVISGMFFD